MKGPAQMDSTQKRISKVFKFAAQGLNIGLSTKGGVEKMRNLRNSKGFTLIELLIVIVIIGILAGVLLSVLNPVQQQNKAKDGVVRSSLDKLSLSTKSLQSSSFTGNIPTRAEFTRGVGSIGAPTGSLVACTTALTEGASGASVCYFSLTGVEASKKCAADDYRGPAGSSSQCNFIYVRQDDSAAKGFRIATSMFGDDAVIVYQYLENVSAGTITEGFYRCDANYDVASLSTALSATACKRQ